MIEIKSKEEVEIMREGGKILASCLRELEPRVIPGSKTADLDKFAEDFIRQKGGIPSFKNYKPPGAEETYPASLCVSVNDEIVHGLPGERTIRDGDVVSLDLGVLYEGFHTDSAVTVIAGKGEKGNQSLVGTAERALEVAIEVIKPSVRIGDIGHAIESFVKEHGYKVIKSLAGHGVGRELHELPDVPNFGRPGTGLELTEGMTFAVEPMVTTGSDGIYLAEDGFTYKTQDGAPVAHFEHTVAVTSDGCEVLTKFG